MADLPTIVQEVNRNVAQAVMESLNPNFDYYICFDQLDLGFDNSRGSEYIWKYKDVRSQFNEAALNYRIHPGLKEVLGLRKFTKSE